MIAAMKLSAANGFGAINLTQIGAEAGIGGTGIYRYFKSKTALLVTLIDRVVDQLVADATTITADIPDPAEALDALILDHIDAALTDREVFQIYLRDAQTLPPDELRRIKTKMRRYVGEWVRVLDQLHPGLSEAELRTIIQAAIGALQSMLNFDARLSRERLTELLRAGAHAVLDTTGSMVAVSERG
jgi:AcrR family transcriptional regulator